MQKLQPKLFYGSRYHFFRKSLFFYLEAIDETILADNYQITNFEVSKDPNIRVI